jgi:hypothetical protein
MTQSGVLLSTSSFDLLGLLARARVRPYRLSSVSTASAPSVRTGQRPLTGKVSTGPGPAFPVSSRREISIRSEKVALVSRSVSSM